MPSLTFHHGAVSVPDLDAAIGWYRDMLGFAVERRFRVDSLGAEVAFVRRGPLRFELFEVAGAAPLPAERRHPAGDLLTHGNKHLAFRVDDLDEFLVEMGVKGADIALVVRDGPARACLLRDCAGNLIEFLEDPNG